MTDAERVKILREAMRKLATWPDCGCLPCRGQCKSQRALEVELEERTELARDALSATEATPPTPDQRLEEQLCAEHGHDTSLDGTRCTSCAARPKPTEGPEGRGCSLSAQTCLNVPDAAGCKTHGYGPRSNNVYCGVSMGGEGACTNWEPCPMHGPRPKPTEGPKRTPHCEWCVIWSNWPCGCSCHHDQTKCEQCGNSASDHKHEDDNHDFVREPTDTAKDRLTVADRILGEDIKLHQDGPTREARAVRNIPSGKNKDENAENLPSGKDVAKPESFAATDTAKCECDLELSRFHYGECRLGAPSTPEGTK